MITIFTYNRLDTLNETAWDCIGRCEAVQIIDDNSNYPFELISPFADAELTTVYRFEHCGKEGFYKLWDFALSRCEDSAEQRFMFLPDDFQNIDFERIDAIYHKFIMAQGPHAPFVVNITNDGRGPQWGAPRERVYNDEVTRVDWVDCGFFCNRAAMEYIGYHMEPVPKERFKKKNISSGVGQQLTLRFRNAGVPMYRPIKSLAFHGDHDSVMHPEERIKNPLISK